MLHRRRFLRLTAALFASCAARAETRPSLRVFAAASLKSALDEIAGAYGKNTGIGISLVYAATSVLARQIAEGAPCDLFIAADREWMDYLAEKNRIDAASRRDLVGNTLVLIAPADGPRRMPVVPGADLAALLGPGERIVLADPAGVPAGKYAKQALQAFGAWAALENRIAAAENVRAALAFVARGAAPLGIVYGSDAVAEPRVRVLAVFDPATHSPIIYPAAAILGASPAAKDFLHHLSGEEAASIFRRWGFQDPDRS